MKIYIALALAFVALFVYALKLNGDKARLEAQSEEILKANKDLNQTLSELIKNSAVEKELLRQKFEADLKNAQKIQRAKSYVKSSSENNVTRLFNDTIHRLH